MGLFDWLRRLFGSEPDETPDDVADRIERVGDRLGNAGDAEGEQAARIAAADARRCGTSSEARGVERDFYRFRGLRPDGRPVKPVVGKADGGPEYVRYGNAVRAGGSKGWRYNNPGYIRCSDRATMYGAIGCDGEYAIFPDHRTGVNALAQHLRTEYPNHRLGDALREQLPPAEADAAAERLREAGIDLGAKLGDIMEQELQAVGEQCAAVTESSAGEVYDRDDPATSWAADGGTEAAAAGASGDDRPTDDS